MGSRWPLEGAAGASALAVLADNGPPGLVDLWSQVPAGATLSRTGKEALLAGNQAAIVQRFATLQQQAAAAVGVTAGYRPELLGKLLPVLEPGRAQLEAAAAVLVDKLELQDLVTGALEPVRDKLAGVLGSVGKALGLGVGVVGLVPMVGQIAAVATWAVSTIFARVREEQAAEAAAELVQRQCLLPVYSAATDRAWASEAVAELLGGDWTRLFLPETRLFDPSYQAWPGLPNAFGNTGQRAPTCCPAVNDRFTVIIAPTGVGLGSRFENFQAPILWPGQADTGLGCVPMLGSPVHRAVVVPSSGSSGPYDAGQDLPELGAVGVSAWRTLWNRGPSAWAVDAGLLADAWDEYVRAYVRSIADNWRPVTVSGDLGEAVCGDWTEAKRLGAAKYLAGRFGARASTAEPEGIHDFSDAVVVQAWRDTEVYQAAMLERLTVLYADASTCAPAWRERLADAQRDALTSSAVCRAELEAIPDRQLRDAVELEQKRRGVACYGVAGTNVLAKDVSATEGPSLEPLGSSSPELPELPEFKPERLGGSTDGQAGELGQGGGLAWALGLGALGLAGWALLKGRGRGLR